MAAELKISSDAQSPDHSLNMVLDLQGWRLAFTRVAKIILASLTS